MEINMFLLAQRFIGLKETPGNLSNPQVLAMLRLDNTWPQGDDVAWCSAFINYIAWLLRLPRSKDLRARSWLKVGLPINLNDAKAENDIVVIKRGGADQPGPDVMDAPGHVGIFAGIEGSTILLLGGNQGDEVNISGFPVERILGIRRLI
jgi:uncharacterized protein (TIGR02594 family)